MIRKIQLLVYFSSNMLKLVIEISNQMAFQIHLVLAMLLFAHLWGLQSYKYMDSIIKHYKEVLFSLMT